MVAADRHILRKDGAGFCFDRVDADVVDRGTGIGRGFPDVLTESEKINARDRANGGIFRNFERQVMAVAGQKIGFSPGKDAVIVQSVGIRLDRGISDQREITQDADIVLVREIT